MEHKKTTRLVVPPLPLLVMRFAREELAALFRRTAYALWRQRPKDLKLADLAIPDSELASRATELARKCEAPFLFNHSVRTYLFGLAIGQQLGLDPDREVFYVASILHDLGLVAEYDRGQCFEIDGAHAAHDFVQQQGMDERRALLVHEAVALHTSVGIAGNCVAEMALLHFGAGLDVIGFHAEDVSLGTRARIVEAWPREDMKKQFMALFDGQVARKPTCHIASHTRLGFGKKVAAAPFAE